MGLMIPEKNRTKSRLPPLAEDAEGSAHVMGSDLPPPAFCLHFAHNLLRIYQYAESNTHHFYSFQNEHGDVSRKGITSEPAQGTVEAPAARHMKRSGLLLCWTSVVGVSQPRHTSLR